MGFSRIGLRQCIGDMLPIDWEKNDRRARSYTFGIILPSGGAFVDSVSAVATGIRGARKEAGLTQEDLAILAGTSERTIRAIETGTGNPSLRAVAAAANVLGLRLTVTR